MDRNSSRRSFLAAVAAAPAAALPTSSANGTTPPAETIPMPPLGRLFCIVLMNTDGTIRKVNNPCVETDAAAQYVSNYNEMAHVTGCRVEARQIDLETLRIGAVAADLPPYVRETWKEIQVKQRKPKHKRQHRLAEKLTAATGGQFEIDFAPGTYTEGDPASSGHLCPSGEAA